MHRPKVLNPVCWRSFFETHPAPEHDHTCPWCGENFPVFCREEHPAPEEHAESQLAGRDRDVPGAGRN